MSVTIEISNAENLKVLRDLLGAKDDSEAVEISIERTIRDYESTRGTNGLNIEDRGHDLPEEYWEELFSQPMLPNNAGSQAVIDERNEDRY